MTAVLITPLHLPQYKTHTAAFERVLEIYHPNQLELKIGEQVIWNRNFKADNIRNGQRATLISMHEKALTFTLEDGSERKINQNNPALKHIDYGYVLTNYKVQGKDAHYGVGLMESHHRYSATLKNFYVQISRAVHGMTLVTDNKESLVRAIEKNKDEKQAALDVLDSEQLIKHQERFKNKTSVSIQSVIDKKWQREASAIVVEPLSYQKQINHIKELERG